MDNDTFLAFMQVADKLGISIVTRGFDAGHGDDHDDAQQGDHTIHPWTDDGICHCRDAHKGDDDGRCTG